MSPLTKTHQPPLVTHATTRQQCACISNAYKPVITNNKIALANVYELRKISVVKVTFTNHL